MRRPGASYRGPESVAADNSQYASRRDTSVAGVNDLYSTGIVTDVGIVLIGSKSIFTPLPVVQSEVTFTRATTEYTGTTAVGSFTKLLTGIYVLDESKNSLSFLPNSLVTFADTPTGSLRTITGVFQTPTGFTMYPGLKYFLWYYLTTPASQDFYGTRAKTFTNGAGQTPVSVVDLSTRQAVGSGTLRVPVITYTTERGATFFKD